VVLGSQYCVERAGAVELGPDVVPSQVPVEHLPGRVVALLDQELGALAQGHGVTCGVRVEDAGAVSLHVGVLHGDLVVGVHLAGGGRPVEGHQDGQLTQAGRDEFLVRAHRQGLFRGGVEDHHAVGRGVGPRYPLELVPQRVLLLRRELGLDRYGGRGCFEAGLRACPGVGRRLRDGRLWGCFGRGDMEADYRSLSDQGGEEDYSYEEHEQDGQHHQEASKPVSGSAPLSTALAPLATPLWCLLWHLGSGRLRVDLSPLQDVRAPRSVLLVDQPDKVNELPIPAQVRRPATVEGRQVSVSS
jgi:hypothetical protein